jgi:hypothetical protein
MAHEKRCPERPRQGDLLHPLNGSLFCNHPDCHSKIFSAKHLLQQHVWSHSLDEAQIACTCAKAPKRLDAFKKHQAETKCQKLDINRAPTDVEMPIYGYFGNRGERNTFWKISELL